MEFRKEKIGTYNHNEEKRALTYLFFLLFLNIYD